MCRPDVVITQEVTTSDIGPRKKPPVPPNSLLQEMAKILILRKDTSVAIDFSRNRDFEQNGGFDNPRLNFDNF